MSDSPLENAAFTGANAVEATESASATAATTAPEVDTAALQSQLQSVNDQIKQYSEYFDRLGGFETTKPMLSAVDVLTGANFEPGAAKQSLEQLAGRERFSAMMWKAIDDSKEVVIADLFADPVVKQSLFSQDPDWALFQQWKALGGNVAQFDLGGIDPESEAGKQFIAMKQEQARLQGQLNGYAQSAQSRAQAERQAQLNAIQQNFIAEQYNFLADSCKKFNWGDDAKEDIAEVIDIVENRFSKNKEAMDDMKIAAKARAEGNEFLAKRYERSVQNRIANLLKEVGTRRGRDISARRSAVTAVTKTAEARREVPLQTASPSNVGAPPKSATQPGKFDFNSALEASLLKALSEGRLPQSK